MPTKICTICQVEMDISMFPKNKIGKHGVGSWCKSCFRDHSRKKYKENRDKEIQRVQKNKERHRELSRISMRKLRQEKPEYFNEYTRVYRKENPDKAQSFQRNRQGKRSTACKGGKFSSLEWSAILDYYNHKCAYCLKSVEKLTMDHVIPLSRGGRHCPSNVVPACKSCNFSKGAKTPFEWIQMLSEAI